MYAVVKTGGKQYRVAQGQLLKVEKLGAEVGETIKLDNVLMISDDAGQVEVGSPVLDKANVEAKVVSHGRHKKIKILKFKRRKHHMKRMGHRQYYTQVEITKISK